jgi:hypothetical protein
VTVYHGAYGGARFTVSLYAYAPGDEVRVSLVGWADDIDDSHRPDTTINLTVDEAAAVARAIEEAVRVAMLPLADIEASARMERARKALAELEASAQLRPDKSGQAHALVPLDLVQRLAATLQPGAYPAPDPWAIEFDEDDDDPDS